MWALLVCLWGVGAGPADEEPAPEKCPVCSSVIADADRVVVTDFRTGTDTAVCGLWCAMKQMEEKAPASRAITHCPVTGTEIRIIRTGVRWVIVPETAVFLLLDEEKFAPPQRWRVFHRQAGYMQFLCRHRELLEQKPRPIRLPEVVRILTTPPPEKPKPEPES